MRRAILGLLLILLAVLFAPRPPVVRAGAPCTVPKSWGHLVGISDWSSPVGIGGVRLAFEAPDGTVRMINANCEGAAVILRSDEK